MCTFISLIAAVDDADRINAVLATFDRRDHRRRAKPDDTPWLRQALRGDEKAYLLMRGFCDCGTYLGSAVGQVPDADHARAARIARYRRRGWSEARIARALADSDRAADRPDRRPLNEDAAYWTDLLTALAAGLNLHTLGLMHHFEQRSDGITGPIVTRQLAVGPDVLAQMQDGVIYDFAADVIA